MNTLTGKTLQGGKYTLEHELGRGGFGITYKATHHYLHSTVVIKTLDQSFRLDANCGRLLRQFQDEARRLALCVHPNIVRISDFFLEAGWPYMVMEYVSGQTLSSVVRTNAPLEEATAVHYIRQIGEALKLVHQQGLLHRDVKPDNILVREETQEVVLIDFGIAREFNPDTTQTHTSIVSDGYAPIEQYLSRAKWTPATDVYGLAATLYWLLTGKKPVSAPLRDREPLPAPKDIRPELSISVNNAVLRGMAVEVQYRPQIMDEWLWLLPQELETQPNNIPVAISQPKTEKTIAFLPQQVSSPSEEKKFPILGTMLIAIATGITIAAGVVWSNVQTSVTQPIEEPSDVDINNNSDIQLEEPIPTPVESPVSPPVQQLQPRRVPASNPSPQRDLPPPKPKAIEKQVPIPVESPLPTPESTTPTPEPTPEVPPTSLTEPIPETRSSNETAPLPTPLPKEPKTFTEPIGESKEPLETQPQEKLAPPESQLPKTQPPLNEPKMSLS